MCFEFEVIVIQALLIQILSETWFYHFNGAQKKTDDNIPMPNYFRFLALLAFKIFAAEQV